MTAFDFATLSPVFCNINVTGILDMGVNYAEEDGVLKMWVLVKKAIHFFVYSQGQFNEYQTIALNDTPLLMEWIDDRLFLQYKDRLVEMRCTDRSILSENRTAVKNAAQLCLKVLSNDALLLASSPNILISSHSVS